jgi:CPA1 family monovalent cation:H+ antiporter
VTLARLLRPRLALPGELVVAKGSRGVAMFFIASGQVEVKVPDGPTRLGPGDFFGELALLTHRPRTADVIALGYCNLLTLEARDFTALLRNNPDLKAEIESVAEHRLAAAAGGQGI